MTKERKNQEKHWAEISEGSRHLFQVRTLEYGGKALCSPQHGECEPNTFLLSLSPWSLTKCSEVYRMNFFMEKSILNVGCQEFSGWEKANIWAHNQKLPIKESYWRVRVNERNKLNSQGH